MSRRHGLNLAVGIVVTAACLAAALWGFDRDDYAAIGASFRTADYRTLPAVLGLLAGFFWLKAVRWSLLLRPLRPAAPLTAVQVLPALLIGFAGNNLLPAHLGEVLRVIVIGRRYGLARTPVASTVVLERVCDVAAILAILGGGLAAAPEAPAGVRDAAVVLAVLLAIGLVGVAVYAVRTAWFVRTAERILARVPLLGAGVRAKAAELLEAGATGMAALRSPRLAAGIAVTSLAQWLVNVAMIDLSLRAFGIDRSPAISATLMGAVAFGVTVPSTPGFFGVIQAIFRAVLVPFGVDAKRGSRPRSTTTSSSGPPSRPPAWPASNGWGCGSGSWKHAAEAETASPAIDAAAEA